MKKDYLKVIVVLLMIMLVSTGCTKELESQIKDKKAEVTGLNRTVTVYGNDGEKIKSYTGKFNIEEDTSSGKVKFDVDGKRVIIYGGIVIAEENVE